LNLMTNQIKKFITRDNIILFITGIMVLYCALSFIRVFFSCISIDISLLIEPRATIILLTYLAVTYLGISFFRGKKEGWYGVTSAFVLLFLQGLFVIVAAVFILLFRDSSLKDMQLPKIGLNQNVVESVFGFIISLIMIRLLFMKSTVHSFFEKGIKTYKLIFIDIAIVLLYLVVCYGAVMLLL